MLKRIAAITSIVFVLALLAFTASACNGAPISNVAQPTPTTAPATATPAPTVAAPPAPQAATTPSAQRRGNPDPKSLANLLRGAGLEGGVVTSNDGSTLNVKLGKLTDQIQVASNVIIVIPDKSNATVSDIRVGDRVIANLTSRDMNASATFLLDVPANYTADNVLTAAVQANKNGTLRLRTRSDARQVTTSTSTIVVNISGDQPALATIQDIKPVNAVLVIGTGDKDSFSAQVIVILDKDVRDMLGKGKQNQPTPTPTPKPGA